MNEFFKYDKFIFLFIIAIFGVTFSVPWLSKKISFHPINELLRLLKIIFKTIRNTPSFILKKLQPLIKLISQYPFQSLLLQVVILYFIFFMVMIKKPTPFLKRWSSLTSTILIGGLIFVCLAIIIQFIQKIQPPVSEKSMKQDKQYLKQKTPSFLYYLLSLSVSVGICVNNMLFTSYS